MAASDNCRAFPEELVREILVRLPVRSLLRFKCACKNWYALIKSPSFIQQHLNCSKNKVLIYDYGAPDDDDSPPMSLIILDDQNQENNPQRFRGMANLLGSVDGLFYLECEFDRELVSCALWNPATREVRPLPLPKPETDDSNFYGQRNFGFGLDPLTNDYKVVHFYPSDFAAAVYSCSRDSWRIFSLLKIKNVADPIYSNAYLNGAYYWLLTGYDYCDILSFDFGSEVFEEIGGPDDHSVRYYVMGLMLLDDSIATLNLVERFDFHVWIMIQPGIWNKLVTFQCCTQVKSCFDSSLILVTRAFRLVSYNVRTKKTRHLGFRHLGLKAFTEFGGCGVYSYKESLVTIKRGEDGH